MDQKFRNAHNKDVADLAEGSRGSTEARGSPVERAGLLRARAAGLGRLTDASGLCPQPNRGIRRFPSSLGTRPLVSLVSREDPRCHLPPRPGRAPLPDPRPVRTARARPHLSTSFQ
ncbi:uncharacterized protein LOC128931901 [Callithrix jacchus]